MKFQCTNCGGGVVKGGPCTSQSCSWSPYYDPLFTARMREKQRLSWAYGQAKFRHPTFTRDDMQRIADQMDGIVRSDT